MACEAQEHRRILSMRLLILPRYSPLGASSRLRSYQYLPALRAAGIEVQVSSLLDDAYLHGLYGGRTPLAPVLRGYGRRWRALREVRHFDAAWVEKEAWPWLPLWLESWLLNGPARLVLDYDDAVFHRYDRHRRTAVRRAVFCCRVAAWFRRAPDTSAYVNDA